MKRVLRAVALAALLVPATPAAAEGGTVLVAPGGLAIPVGTGYLVEMDCTAVALTGRDPRADGFGDVPVSTTVSCSVNGVGSTVTANGPVATTAFATIAASRVYVCYSASAAFFDPFEGVGYQVDVAERCFDGAR